LSLRGKKLSPRPRHHSRFLPYRPRQGTVRRNKAQLLLKVGLATVACGGSKNNATWRGSNRRRTATEIALLGISASEAAKGISVWSILVFPALFTAGMSLVDTTDGVLMLGAYGWAFVNPIRKLYYNLTITGVSVVVALAIGSIETLGLVADELGLDGGIWNVVNAANDNFGALGYAIIGVFVASWLISLVVYRVMGYDKLNP
jgi:hypothetical protein